jgi:predicted enzyme related to lactoylglutathione lyase
MSERTSYEPGTPSWVDLATPDPAAAKQFYGQLFGWQAEDAGPPEETGGYAMFTLRGKNVAGVSPLMNDDQPAVWSTYVATDDADAVVARAKDAGGQAIVEPMDVMDAGRMAFVMHPAGGAIGVWQAGRHTGAELVNEPGTFAWSQLHTRDQDGAAGFLGAVFGWTRGNFGGIPVLNVAERGVASMMDMPPGTPDQVPAYWMAIFASADPDGTAAKAKDLGGQAIVEPFDIPNIGRFTVLADPQGVAFGVATAAAAEM